MVSCCCAQTLCCLINPAGCFQDHLTGHDVSWCWWWCTTTPAMHRAQLSCFRTPSGGHGHDKGTWVDMSCHIGSDLIFFHCFLGPLEGQRQPTGRSAHRGCFVRWELFIRRTYPNHWRWFHRTRFPAVGCSCNGGVSFHSIAGRVGLPIALVFGGDSLSARCFAVEQIGNWVTFSLAKIQPW